MKKRLIKIGKHYCLLEGDRFISTTDCPEGTANKLSLKNCQAIERGYDLDARKLFIQAGKEYLGESFDMLSMDVDTHQIALIAIRKALEILGDKKFSHGQMLNAMDLVWEWMNGEEYGCGTLTEVQDKYIQSLQQTEWDVIVEMECVIGCQNLILNGENSVCCGDKKPKISEDGCLILKSE